MQQLLNDGWSFCMMPLGSELDDLRGVHWTNVDLPHDWLISQSHLYQSSDGWYTRTLHIEDAADSYYVLRFEGVYMDATVLVNGQEAMSHAYGYTTFDCYMTPFLQEGENTIHVHVRYQAPNSRWYSGAGIFRDVTLHVLGNYHIAMDGLYVQATVNGDDAFVAIETELESFEAGSSLPKTLTHQLYSPQGACVAESTAEVCHASDQGEKWAGCVGVVLAAHQPELWSCEVPALYRLVTTFGDQTITTNVGFRTIEMTADRGFFLNGEHIKLKGVCLHHDLGALGAAYSSAAARRQLVAMQRMGANALRTAHNPPASDVMNLCDELGILVVDEIFDMWERPKTPYDYARFFGGCYKADVRSWVRRDRNHPCLIMWSIGNEILDTHIDARGLEVTKMLASEVSKHDPKGNAKTTIGSNFMPWQGAQNCAEEVAAAGYNYAEKYYDEHHAQHPNWIIYGSETASTLSSRGIYRFPIEASILSDSDLQCSALGNSTSSWGTKSLELCIVDDLNTPYSLGQFLWSGIDYIGEPTPYFTRNCYFGQADTACFEKDSYYLFQSLWTSSEQNPMVHIGVIWDFNAGQLIDVPVYSNASEVELLLNGQSIGRRKLDRHSVQNCDAKWKVPYQTGMLEARAYDEQGTLIAQDVQKSFGDAASIILTMEGEILYANGEDIAFVQITMADEDGHAVCNANNRVAVSVEGAGRLVGMDNGDSTDLEGYQVNSRRLFSGKLLAMVAANQQAGEIVVRVSSAGLLDAELRLHSSEATMRGGIACSRSIQHAPASAEIPIRKLDITILGSDHLNAENQRCEVVTEVMPDSAIYSDITWCMTNELGINTPCASIVQEDGRVFVQAAGDGMVYLRAMANNGYDHPRIISQKEITITGMGTPLLNPYELIWGGMYDLSEGDVGPGNEKGVATARDGWSMVGFQNVDFGDAGADEITLPIFALNDEIYPIQIFSGDPREDGSERIGIIHYQKPSIWNVYQEVVHRFDTPLYGVQTICFALEKKVHIKGFSFARRIKAYTALPATRCDSVYGDQFEKTEQGIESIGNNVSIVYENMNFDGEETAVLSICGKTSLTSQPITLRMLNHEGKEISQLVEFRPSGTASTQRFMVSVLHGQCSVSLVFLPGSQFDFFGLQFTRESSI